MSALYNVLSLYFEKNYCDAKDSLKSLVEIISSHPSLKVAIYYAVAWVSQSGTEIVTVLVSLKRSICGVDDVISTIQKDLNCIQLTPYCLPSLVSHVASLEEFIKKFSISGFVTVYTNIESYLPIATRQKESYLLKASVEYEVKYVALTYRAKLGEVLSYFLTRDYPIHDFSIQMNDKRLIYVVMHYSEAVGSEVCFRIGDISPMKVHEDLTPAHYNNKLSAQRNISTPIKKKKPANASSLYAHECLICDVDSQYDSLMHTNGNILYASLTPSGKICLELTTLK